MLESLTIGLAARQIDFLELSEVGGWEELLAGRGMSKYRVSRAGASNEERSRGDRANGGGPVGKTGRGPGN